MLTLTITQSILVTAWVLVFAVSFVAITYRCICLVAEALYIEYTKVYPLEVDVPSGTPTNACCGCGCSMEEEGILAFCCEECYEETMEEELECHQEYEAEWEAHVFSNEIKGLEGLEDWVLLPYNVEEEVAIANATSNSISHEDACKLLRASAQASALPY